MKLVLLGPVYPYKGGISHYTGLMCRALAKKHEVVMVSYKLQYPSFLFKKEQKDCSNDNFKIEDTRFWLNTMNPFNWIQTARNIKQKKPDAKDLLPIIECALHVVTPHPTYNAFEIKNMQEKEARERLNIKDDVPLLLFFGFVREYKGLKYFINQCQAKH